MDKDGVISITDESEAIEPFLSNLSRAVLSKNSIKELKGEGYDVRFIGTTKNVQSLAYALNEYAEAFNIVGVFASPFSISLIPDTINGATRAYMCFLAFTPAAARQIDKLIQAKKAENFFQEGEVPNG